MDESRAVPGWLGRGVRRHLVLVVVLTAVGALLGGWWGSTRDRVHEARAAILVSPLLGNPFSPEAGGDDLVNLTTEAELVGSDAVAQLVSDRLAGRPEVSDLLAGLSVAVPANTQVLEITARHRNSGEAVRRAQAFATTFLAYREGRLESTVFDRSARVKELIADRSASLNANVEALAKLPADSARVVPLRQQVVDLTSQISELRTQLAALESASRDAGQVVTPAALRSSWLQSPALLGVGAGAVAGLLLGVVIALARRDADDRVLDISDLDALGVTHFGPVREGDDPEGARGVRSALLGTVPQRPMVVLVGTSPQATRPVRSTGALARSLGTAGMEVVVLDARPVHDHGPMEGAAPMAAAGAGLTDLIADPASLDDVLAHDEAKHVELGRGSTPRMLDDLVDSPETAVLFEELRKRADVVLVVTGSLATPLAQSLARHVDAVVVEVVEGVSGLGDVRDGLQRFLAGDRLVAAMYLRPRLHSRVVAERGAPG